MDEMRWLAVYEQSHEYRGFAEFESKFEKASR